MFKYITKRNIFEMFLQLNCEFQHLSSAYTKIVFYFQLFLAAKLSTKLCLKTSKKAMKKKNLKQ